MIDAHPELLHTVIRPQTIVFSESSTFNRSEEPMRKFRADIVQYVGDPSPEIDRHWDALVENQYFWISAADAKDSWGPDYWKYWRDQETGAYRAG